MENAIEQSTSTQYQDFEREIKATKTIFRIDSKQDKRNKNVNLAKPGWSDELVKTKRDVSRMLETSTAYAVKSRIANKLMRAGDFVPAHLPTANTLRKQNTYGADPIEGLRNMKLQRFRNDIQNIGLDPFFVYYSTPLQREWYNTQFRRRNANISIDASGLGLTRLNTTLAQGLLLYVITAFGM